MARPLFKESNFSCVKNGPRAAKYGGELKEFSSASTAPKRGGDKWQPGVQRPWSYTGIAAGLSSSRRFFEETNEFLV